MTTEMEKPVGAGSGDGIDAQLTLLASLAGENEARAESLRCVQIPHHVGMAAAARALAADLPRAFIAQLQGDLSSGALGEKWEAALKRVSGTKGELKALEAALAAVATMLIEQAQRTGKYLSSRGDDWASDAYRLEGQAVALEEQVHRLQRAQEGIARSRAEGQRTAARQEQRREERERGDGPGSGKGHGNDT